MYEASKYDTGTEAIERPSRASEHAKNIFGMLSMAGSRLGLLVADVANTWLK